MQPTNNPKNDLSQEVATNESSEHHSIPADEIWKGLLNGDPGPVVALFDGLMDSDFAFAAGGLLRDLAERIHDIHEVVEDKEQQSQFTQAARQAILCCLDNDSDAAEDLLREVTNDSPK